MESIGVVSAPRLSAMIRCRPDKTLIIDSRTFCEYNTSKIVNSVNVWSSKLRKKRLQQDSISVHDYLQQACLVRVTGSPDIIVYDQNAPQLSAVPQDSFLHVLLTKLGHAFSSVALLAGGFLEFQAAFPELCEDCSQKCTPLTSLSQPCLPVANIGPTRILPFLYLGSQHDANNRQLLQDHNILYEVNVSTSCPKPDFMQDSHFLRIPVNDNFSEKLLPFFSDTFRFIDKVRESGGCVLVHCLAGISRSPTVSIAYVMKHLRLPYDEAYRYVKHRRPTISPNINFVGQLLELDKKLRHEGILSNPLTAPGSAPVLLRGAQEYTSSFTVLGSSSSITSSTSSSNSYSSKRTESHSSQLRSSSGMPRSLSLNLRSTLEAVPASPSSTPQSPVDLSPSSALAKLTFSSALVDEGFPIFPSQDKLPSSPVTPNSSSPLFFANSPYHGIPTAIIDTNKNGFNFKKTGSISDNFNSYFSREESHCVSDSVNDNNKRGSAEFSFNEVSNSSNNFFSSASINLGGDETASSKRRPSESEGRKMSVCVIEVNHEPSTVNYVKSISTEPMVIKETQVFATPCINDNEDCDNNNLSENNSVKINSDDKSSQTKREIIVPIRLSAKNYNQNSDEKRPTALQLSVPDFSQPLQSQSAGGEVTRPLGSPIEATTADSNDAAMPVSPANNSQLSETIQTPTENSPLPNKNEIMRFPRCYSSSETHLNTRRLLENRAAGPDYSTRKSSSTDEMGRGWSHHPPPTIHTQPPCHFGRDSMTCPGELARCDSWSTSGLGSEISDWESLQDDSVHNEDALGPFDAVFSDVFPGESNDIPLRSKDQSRTGSYKENTQPGTPRTPRPASLPGVMGTYLSQLDNTTNMKADLGVDLGEGVELRPVKGRSRVARNDSGFYSFPVENSPMGEGVKHSSNSSQKDRPKDLQITSFSSLCSSSDQFIKSPKTPLITDGIKSPLTDYILHEDTSIPNGRKTFPITPESKPPLNLSERRNRLSQEKAMIRLSSLDSYNNKNNSEKLLNKMDSPKTKLQERHVTLYEVPYNPSSDKILENDSKNDNFQPNKTLLHDLKNENLINRSYESSPEKRATPEKRKLRGCSVETTDEKRRSCDTETDSIWKTARQPLTLGAGSQIVDDLVHMENVLDSKMSEIRRCTEAISQHLQQINSKSPPSATPTCKSNVRSSGVSRSPCKEYQQTHTSKVYLNMAEREKSLDSKKDIPFKTPNLPVYELKTHSRSNSYDGQDEINITVSNIKDHKIKTYICGGPMGQKITVEHWDGGRQHLVTVEQRSQSEPPFMVDEGLYRARSCPGLPRPDNAEKHETVGALVSDLQMVKLRGTKQNNKNKIFNRYSCGALDFQNTNVETSFDSCPDFGKLHPCARGGDSLQSSNSSLSSHSSFTRLLQVS